MEIKSKDRKQNDGDDEMKTEEEEDNEEDGNGVMISMANCIRW